MAIPRSFLSGINLSGVLQLSSAPGTSGQILISQGAGNTPAWTSSPNLLNPLLTSISTVGGGGSEGGQINFARTTDGTAYWYIDTFGSTSTPDLRVIENATERFRFVSGGALSVNGSTGTSGQVLTSAGGSAPPTWTSISGSLGYLGTTQTTSGSGGTSTLAGINTFTPSATASIQPSSVATATGIGVSLIAGTTSASTGTPTGGSVTITGGAQTNGTVSGNGGSVSITGGASGAQGIGGNITITGGAGGAGGGTVTVNGGSSAGGNGYVNVGTSNTDVVTLGSSGKPIYIQGNLSLESGSGAIFLTTSGNLAVPTIFSVNSSILFNVGGNSTAKSAGEFTYSGNSGNAEIYAGAHTSSGYAKIPAIHEVFSLANSSASTNTTQSVFAAANDVLSLLQANKLYKFRAKYYSSFTYSATSGAININFAFSNGPTAIKYTFNTYPQTAGTTTTQRGVSTVTTATTIVPTQSTSGTWVTEIEGYFTTHATLTSTFTPQFICTASTSSSAVIQAGSWFEVEKIGTATTTLVAGNWA